jgi:GT2 family glycosyltransferase
VEPKVSILWINYNSSSFIDLALESIRAVKDLDYSNYELIIVDNGSVDDSLKTIKSFVEKMEIKSKIIELKKNRGYTGGNNIAYAARDHDSKYIVLLNSDAVPQKDSLRKLVQIIENDGSLGAVQSVILNYDEKTIDTAGDYLSELLGTYSRAQGKLLKPLRKWVYVTSADGAYSIYRVKAVKKTTNHDDSFFDDFIFACLDDYMLGLKVWNNGFKVKAVPLITAKHRRGSSFKKVGPLLFYLGVRNRIILNEISNSKYKNLLRLFFVKQLYVYFLFKIFGLKTEPSSKEIPALLSKAFLDGIRIGRMKKKLGETIDMYKAPILRIKPLTAFLGIMTRPRLIDTHLRKELDKIAF